MLKKRSAVIDITKAIAGVPFTILAAVGSASGNLLFAGLAAIPNAILVSYDTVSNSLREGKIQSRKVAPLELPMPYRWSGNYQSWQSCCTEIENRLPDVLQRMIYHLKQQQGFITEQHIQQAFIETVTDEPLHIWMPNREERKQVAESIAVLLLIRLNQVLSTII